MKNIKSVAKQTINQIIQQQSHGFLFYITYYTNVTLSCVFCCLYTHYLLTKDIKIHLIQDKRQFFAILSLYVFVNHLIKYILELINIKFRLLQDLKRCQQKTIDNTLLFTFVLAGLMINNSGIISETDEIILLQLFIVGRILFGIGYLFGVCVGNQSFRSYGLSLVMMTIISYLLAILGTKFLQNFK